MLKVKTYSEYIGESLLNTVKVNWRMTKVNAFAFEKSAELMQREPRKYKKTSDTLNGIKNDVEKKYNDIMSGIDGVQPFAQWWKEFSEKMRSME